MDIPEFPHSRPLSLSDKPLFDRLFSTAPPQVSGYTFTNICAWRHARKTSVTRMGEAVLLQEVIGGATYFCEPLGTATPATVILAVLQQHPAADTVTFRLLSQDTADALAGETGCAVTYDRNNSDYLYRAEDLIKLPGRRYDSKRNFINRITSQHAFDYVPLNETTIDAFRAFVDYWCDERKCDFYEGLQKEHFAIHQMLSNYQLLQFKGGAIRIDGGVSAIALGEQLNPDTFVVHVEKAATTIDGLYQLINNEFAKNAAAAYRYINREQDLGIPGLRKAKKSYKPVRMVETYTVRKVKGE